MQQERDRTRGDPTFAHEPTPRSVVAPITEGTPTSSGSSAEQTELLNVFVTPKLTFSLRRQATWKTAADIPQEDLREAFLSRFPVRFDTSQITFQSATPSILLREQERLVYRISWVGIDDEKLLPKILSSVDKAYTAKYDRKIEEARADLLSSSMSFQVMADEIREAQAAYAKKSDKEARSLKEQMSTNQKRLFLLEREKEGLQKSVAASDETTVRLQRNVDALTHENMTLRERQNDLESQVQALREAVAQHLEGAAAASPSPTPGAAGAAASAMASVTVATQTEAEEGEAEAAQRLAVERWQQQLSMMSEWLRTGAELLVSPPSSAPAAASAPEPTQLAGLVPPVLPGSSSASIMEESAAAETADSSVC